MVDREQNLGSTDIPTQRGGKRTRESVLPPIVLSERQLKTFFPGENCEFNRIPLTVTGEGIEEIGIHSTGERIEAYELGPDGKRTALRGVLTGYQGKFGSGLNQEIITIDLVGKIVGNEMSTELFTDMPALNVHKRARAVAKKSIPIAVGTNMRTSAIVLVSRTPAGLLTDLTHLEVELGSFSFRARKTLHRAKNVAQYLRYNFKSELPPDQPGRAKVRGQ